MTPKTPFQQIIEELEQWKIRANVYSCNSTWTGGFIQGIEYALSIVQYNTPKKSVKRKKGKK